ncbi:MAG: DUF4384 domain-containing protein [Candidatus Krumholzibacteriota bacterium]|nr:DUF4384 domain-containing protein [Candidatus Krumholzibacteriota bacterium]
MRRILILTAILTLAIQPAWAARMQPLATAAGEDLRVDIWLNREEGAVYDRGDVVSVNFRTSHDAYLAVYNIDVDGYLTLLYPRYADAYWVPAERITGVPGPDDDFELVIDNRKGIEYVVAVASPHPLRLELLDPLGATDYRVVDSAGRITGDPSEAIWELNQGLAWGDADSGPEGYASDVTWFYVRERVPYPRFLVYDWYPDRYWDPFWDPYVSVVIWVDFRWDHHWCGPRWWRRGHRPAWVYWYRRQHDGPQLRWKHVIVHGDDLDYRSKPPRAVVRGDRTARYKDSPDRFVRWPATRAWGDLRRLARPGNRLEAPATRTGRRDGAPTIQDPPRRAEIRPDAPPQVAPERKPRPKPEAKPQSKPERKRAPEKKEKKENKEKKPDTKPAQGRGSRS